jgi:hypothetical protein
MIRMTLCWCQCHRWNVGDRPFVDASDVVEAAAACEHCRSRHCIALMNDELPNDPQAPEPRTYDPTAWVDRPPANSDAGEGAE